MTVRGDIRRVLPSAVLNRPTSPRAAAIFENLRRHRETPYIDKTIPKLHLGVFLYLSLTSANISYEQNCMPKKGGLLGR